jgi:hypothetical protein
MSMKCLVVIGSLALVLMCTASHFDNLSAAEWEHYAIAVSTDYSRSGCAWGRSNQHARDEALSICGPDCRVVMWASSYRRECAALAVGDNNAMGWGRSAQEALRNCNKHGSNCHIQQ